MRIPHPSPGAVGRFCSPMLEPDQALDRKPGQSKRRLAIAGSDESDATSVVLKPRLVEGSAAPHGSQAL